MIALQLLAAGEEPSAGPIGALVVLLMGVATVLLIRNMNGRLRRLPREFPEPLQETDETADGDEPATPPRPD